MRCYRVPYSPTNPLPLNEAPAIPTSASKSWSDNHDHDVFLPDAMVAITVPARSWLNTYTRPPWYMYPYHVQRQGPRRFLRLLLAVAIIVSAIVWFITTCLLGYPAHHAPWMTPAASNLVVHGHHVQPTPEPLYPLVPFPESPMHEPSSLSQMHDGPQPPWLVTVISPATDAARRMLIRATWMRLYRDVPFTSRFVISNPGPQWTENIRIENRTFGDMIVLDHLQEDDVTANTIKTIELYKWLIDRGHRYEFVSKMDTDLWFNARGFWDRYLSPLLTNETGTPSATVDRTIIGELYYSPRYDLVFPHGAMYTATWDMVETLSRLQMQYNVVTGEDMAVAMLMLKGREVGNMINFKGTEKFDYDDGDSRGDGTAWARTNSHPHATHHAVGKDAIAVHELKDERTFLKVADCFDENGVRDEEPTEPEQSPPLYVLWWDFLHRIGLTRQWTSRFERIPDFLWSFDNGNWVCDGIWRLGRTRSGYLEDL